MGHTEMLLAVAGLDQKTIDDRTKKLAEGDWSIFPPDERAALAVARKVTEAPAGGAAAEFADLERLFVPARALDVLWWAGRCHYMTRVADAFQLPLERGKGCRGRGGNAPLTIA